MRRTWNETERLAFFLCKEPVMGAKPGAILRVRSWVVRKTSKTHIPANSGQVATIRVNDIEDPLLRKSMTLQE
jgi:hypothetical protein